MASSGSIVKCAMILIFFLVIMLRVIAARLRDPIFTGNMGSYDLCKYKFDYKGRYIVGYFMLYDHEKAGSMEGKY